MCIGFFSFRKHPFVDNHFVLPKLNDKFNDKPFYCSYNICNGLVHLCINVTSGYLIERNR